MRLLLVISLGLSCLLGGCALADLDPARDLNETIRGMNDAVRWGRVDLALQYIDPGYRGRFLATHRGWGRMIKVADSELVRIEMDSNKDKAVALVAFSWYRMDQMTLHETVVRQVWRETDGGYILDSEDVVEGDALLLAAPVDRSRKLGSSASQQTPASS